MKAQTTEEGIPENILALQRYAPGFYMSFGQDSYGTIGNAATVHPIDIIGIYMTAIKALKKRTADLK